MPTQIESHPKKYITVDGRRMAYVELGDPNGRPIIFQHGNPTSSYLWRNIMPHVQDLGRCIAIDLIGMGDSEKLPDSGPDRYTFAEHSAYFEAALEALGLTNNAVLVIHDWGSALGFHYASRHASRVAGICYMEAIVAPIPTWDEWPDNGRDIFQAFRSSAGEEVVLEKNVILGGDVSVKDNIRIGEGSIVAGASKVFNSFPKASKIGGSPAQDINSWKRLVAAQRLSYKKRKKN